MRLVLIGLLFAALLSALACGHAWERYDGEDPEGDDDGAGDDADDDDADEGEKIQDFTWTTVDGEDLVLYDYEGYVIALNVGAGWCPGCKEETPVLENTFWNAYKDEEFVVIQLLTEDTSGNEADLEFAAQWRDEYGVTFPLCIDPDWSLEPYFLKNSLPFTLLVDRGLTIRARFHGFDEDIFKALVEDLL